MSLTPEQRKLRARLAAHTRWSQQDPPPVDRAPVATRFLDEVDPKRILGEDERYRRARHAQEAHNARLALHASLSGDIA